MALIRRATKDDFPQIISLLKSFPEDPEIPNINWEDAKTVLPVLLSEEHGLILVSEDNGVLAGLVTMSFPIVLRFGGEYALIEDFIVDEKFRGRGIGTPLLKSAFEEARARGCRELQVNGASEIGTPVYIKNGLHEAGQHLKIFLR
jgi:GNAT superfamily N-acetyltransferase